MTENNFTLLMQLGPNQGDSVAVQGDEFVLGRDHDSQWAIEDIEVSRRHARLLLDKGSYSIEDLGSTNGTFVNGQRIRTLLPLLPGATIRLGENVLLFYDVQAEEKETDTKTVNTDVEPLAKPEKKDPIPPPKPKVTAQLNSDEVKQEKVEITSPEPEAASIEAPVEEPVAKVSPAPKRKVRPSRGIDFSENVSLLGSQISLGIVAIAIIGVLAISAFLWYVDANFLWCDVFGNLIPACR